MSITFKKKVSSTPNIRLPSGTRLNSNGTLLLTSSGISSLDTFIGGGLPIGSLLLIYEDKNANLSDSILRCYLSEGIYNKHDLCVASLRTDLTENLPIKEDNLPSDNRLDDENEKMKIAWRYENLSTIDSSSISNIHYDLQTTKTFPTELINQIKIHKLTWNDYIQSQTSISYRHYLLQTLHKLLTKDYSSQQTDKRILRIGIQSLSLSLFDDKNTNHFDELFTFLYHLRILLRTSLATCIITLNEKSKLFETLADIIFELKLSNLIHNDYVAFCQLIKLPRLNTIQPFIPDTWDIGIKLLKHRRNIIFEKYSLPPDLSEDASRDEKNKSLGCAPSKQFVLFCFFVDVMMDEEEDDTSSFRPHIFDLSMKRSNSSPALPLLVHTTENDMQFDDADFCDAKLRRHSSSFSSHQSRPSRFAHIMKNELSNPIVDEASQERDLHDNLKMSISFTDLAVGDDQQSQLPPHTIDSRRSSVNSSDSSNLGYSSSPSPSTPARPCAVVSNQRQCYSPALQQQVAPFQCYLASPPSRSQSPIGMMTNNTNTTNNNNSSNKITSFPPNLKRKHGDDSTTGCSSKKNRIGSDNESLFGPTNSPESPSPGLIESSTNLLTTQQSLNLLSSIPPSLSSSSSTTNGNDNTHFQPIQHPDIDLFPPPNSPSICPSPTNSTCSSSSSLTFTPISPASTTSSSSSSFLLLPANFNRSTVIPSLILPSATKHIGINVNCSKLKSSNRNQFRRDRSLDEASSLQPLSFIIPRTTITQDKSTSPTTEEQFFFSSDDNNSTTAQ